MRWSKLKQRIEAIFSECVRGRVALRQTRYRESHDQEGEFWITVDGTQVLSSGSLTAMVELSVAQDELRAAGVAHREAHSQAVSELERQAVLPVGSIVWQLANSLNQSIDEIMGSPNPIVRGLGLLDRRFGLRRLKRLDVSTEHEFVALMFKLRRDAEKAFKKQPASDERTISVPPP